MLFILNRNTNKAFKIRTDKIIYTIHKKILPGILIKIFVFVSTMNLKFVELKTKISNLRNVLAIVKLGINN